MVFLGQSESASFGDLRQTRTLRLHHHRSRCSFGWLGKSQLSGCRRYTQHLSLRFPHRRFSELGGAPARHRTVKTPIWGGFYRVLRLLRWWSLATRSGSANWSHNMDREGGQKSGIPRLVLSAWATASPGYFAAYVRDPQAENPHAQMPGNPAYDDATVGALVAYFRTFIPPSAASSSILHEKGKQ